MFKILIADDEKFIRKGICTILERNLTEEVCCIEARNGFEALDITERETPNLIITDISMPGCDGLEFVKKLKEKQVNTAVIILSGYENFEYAKQAMKLGIKEYVMKPIKKAEFIELVTRYMSDIKQQQLKSREEIERKIENRRIVERVKKEFLVGLLKCSNNEEASQYIRQLKDLKINFEPQLCTCVVFQYGINEDNREYIDFVVKNILDEYLSLKSEEFLLNVTYDTGKNISIFRVNKTEAGNEEQQKLIREAARLVREYGRVRVFAGIGNTAPDFEHLNSILRHALQAVDYKIFDSGDIICVYNKIVQGTEIELPRTPPQTNLMEIRNELNRIYGLGQTRMVMEALRIRYDETRDYIHNQLAKKAAIDRKETVCKEFSQCWTLDELKQELKKGLTRLEEWKGESNAVNVQLMEQMVQFVNDNITNELDLNLMARQFHRTPGYISTMFKRYVEGGFNSYVTEKRMDIAKKLLRIQTTPIQEIAEACGYYNAKYFSVVFKKSVGQTPREYREYVSSKEYSRP